MAATALGLGSTFAAAGHVSDPCSYVRFCPDDEMTCRLHFLYPAGLEPIIIDRDGYLLDNDGHRLHKCSAAPAHKGGDRHRKKKGKEA